MTLSLQQRTFELAKVTEGNVPTRFHRSLRRLTEWEPSEAMQTLLANVERVHDRREMLILAGHWGIGKTLAIYSYPAMVEALKIGRELEHKQEAYRHWRDELRPETLARGEPVPTTGLRELNPHTGEPLPDLMYSIALRQYQKAVEEPHEPDWDEVERELMSGVRIDAGDVVTMQDLLDSAFGNSHWLDRFLPKRRALIDDAGREYLGDKDYYHARCRELFDFLYRWEISTVMTTNRPLEDTKEGGQKIEGWITRYGEGIIDRIAEASGDLFVSLAQQESYRGRDD